MLFMRMPLSTCSSWLFWDSRDDHDRQNYESILSKVVKRDSWHGIHYTTVRRSVRKAKQEM